MQTFRRTSKGKIKRFKKEIQFTVISQDEKLLDRKWSGLFSEFLSCLDLFSDYEENIPSHIDLFLGSTYETISKSNRITESKKDDLENLSNELLTIIEPKYSLSDIVLPDTIKDVLEEIIFYCTNKDEIEKEIIPDHLKNHQQTGIYINFFGLSGTGKTMSAEIIAGRLKKKLMVVNYANLESELVGRTSKNIHAIFKIANKDDCVLAFDEADSFLSSRISELRQSADYSINTSRSQLLKELESYSGIVIFATNNIKNYDKAFQRRLHYNVNFPLPDSEARLKILRKNCFSKLISSEVNFSEIASQIEGFSGGDIQNLVKRAIVRGMRDVKDRKSTQIEQEHFDYGIESVRLSRAAFGLISDKPIEVEFKNAQTISQNGILQKLQEKSNTQ